MRRQSNAAGDRTTRSHRTGPQLGAGETVADSVGWAAKRPTRLALVSAGYTDGYPRSGSAFDNKLQAIVGGQRCPVAGHPSMDL